MNTLERSFAYITRKKTRSLIVLLILSVITSSIYACLSIGHANRDLEQRISKTSNSSFSILKNPSAKTSGAPQGIKPADIETIAKNPAISGVNYKHTTDVKLQTGQVISGNQSIQVDNVDEKFKNLLKLHSISDSSRENSFTSEAFKLISGNHIKTAADSHQILIHEKLAKQNNLKLGDKITLSSLTKNPVKSEFTIAGIFSGQIQEDFKGLSSDLSENTVYTNFHSGRPLAAETATAEPHSNPADQNTPANSAPSTNPSANPSINPAKTPSSEALADSATFFLSDPEKIDQIIADIKKQPLNWQDLTVVKNTKAFENIISSVKTMKGIIGVMTIGIIAAGIAALSLILVLWLRERIYEIGILLAIGQDKLQIIGQFILELVLISLPAILVTVVVGNILSGFLLDSLLAGEDLNSLASSLSVGPFSLSSLIILVKSCGILLAIIASSVIITSFTILSQKPKKILSKIS